MFEDSLTSKMSIGGAIVYSRVGPSDRAKLVAGLTDAGYKRFIPEERTAFSALQGALQTVYKKKAGKDSANIMVRPLDDKAGFAVVRERRGDKDDGNSYESLMTATVPTDAVPIKMFGAYEFEDYEATITAYQVCKNVVGTSAVSRCLDRIIESFDGVDLTAGPKRRNQTLDAAKKKAAGAGGTRALWWLSKHKIDDLKSVAAIIEGAGITKAETPDEQPECVNRVHVITCIADESMVRAVGDGLTTELTNEVGQIEYDLANEEMTVKKLGNRREKAIAMRSKLERYERAFDVYIAKLHDDLDRVDVATAQAIMLESAASAVEGAEDLELVVA